MEKTRYIAKLGLLLALASALQFLEGLIPLPLPLGVKPGISSVVIMYILIFMGFKPALATAILKSCFVFVTRGASAFFMSVCGGVLSVLVMALCVAIYRRRDNNIGILVVSAAGGVFHNIGQLAAASVVAESVYTVMYLPVLVAAGVISGVFTGFIMRIIIFRTEKALPVSKHKSSSERSNL